MLAMLVQELNENDICTQIDLIKAIKLKRTRSRQN